MATNNFRDLIVWQKSMDLTVMVYQTVKSLPKEEQYSLSDQIRRAAVSIPSNIAEGSGRKSLKEQIHFLEISYGSLMETYNQLLIAIDLDYITEESVEAIKPNIDGVAKMINGLSSSYSKKLEEQASTKQINK